MTEGELNPPVSQVMSRKDYLVTNRQAHKAGHPAQAFGEMRQRF